MRLSVNDIPEYTRYIITIPDNADNELLMIKQVQRKSFKIIKKSKSYIDIHFIIIKYINP